MALAALEGAHWSAVAPSGPLRYWRLIEFAQAGGASSAPITTRPLRIDERILNFLIGIPHVDERITGLVELLSPPMGLLSSHQLLAKRVARTLSKLQTHAHSAVLLFGADTASARQIAVSACRELTLTLICCHWQDCEGV